MLNQKYYFYYLASLLFLWFFTWASGFNLIPIWLNNAMGVTSFEVGILFTSLSVTALCIQPLYGFIQDKLGLKKTLIVWAGFMLFCLPPFYLYAVKPIIQEYAKAGAILGGMGMALGLNAGIGVLESYTERVSRLVGFEYGRCRSIGSAGFAAGMLFAGHWYNINPDLNFYVAAGSATLFLLGVLAFRPLQVNAVNKLAVGNPERVKLADALALFKQRRLWMLLWFMGGVSIYNVYDQQFAIFFTTQFETEEAGRSAYGWLTSSQVFLEAAMLAIAPFIVKRTGVKNALLLAGAIMAFRVAGSGVVVGPISVSFMKMLHGIELPILLVAMFKYITSRFDSRLSSTLYLVVFQFTGSVFAAILSTIAGSLYQVLGYRASYVAMGCLCAVIMLSCVWALVSDKECLNQKGVK